MEDKKILKTDLFEQCYVSKKTAIAVNLFAFGLDIIESAFIIKDFDKYRSASLGQDYKALMEFDKHRVVDNFKIITYFENYCKGILLLKGYLVHIPKKIDLKSPLSFNDYCNQFSSVTEALDNLKDKTITISQCLSADYQKLIMLNELILKGIQRINEDRNHLHFLESVVAVHGRMVIEELEAILVMVKLARAIADKHNVGKILTVDISV